MYDWNKGDENGLHIPFGNDDYLDDGFFSFSKEQQSSVVHFINCINCGHNYDEHQNNYHCPVCGTHSMPF